ncbi:MAG: VWA domain-containing protein [bacterium]|nr:VWA domain-containing protein [bacterium]
MIFANPIVLILLPVIVLACLKKNLIKIAAPYPSVKFLATISPSLKTRLRKPILGLLGFLFLSFLTIAAARPQITKTEESPKEARDLMLVLDISGSMKEVDFSYSFRQLNRLDAVKLVVSEFIKTRAGDRIGITVFGTQAFLQSPLTADHELLVELLNLLDIGVAGEGTAIGEGLGVALKSLKDIVGNVKAIVLITDGSNNSGQVSPIQAANIAKKLGIKIHTIGIGSKNIGGISSLFAQTPEYDGKTLKEIADSTGGLYFNASNIEGLKSVYNEIDRLEKRVQEEPLKIVVKEYFPEFTLAAIVTYLIYLSFAYSVFLKVP